MAAVDRFRRAANYGRKVADRVGVRLTTVTVVVETWSAAHNMAGATLLSTASTILSPRFKCVAIGDGIDSTFGGGGDDQSGAPLRAGVFRIGPITRSFPGGGYTELQLCPRPTSPAQRVYWKLDDGGDQFTSGGEKFTAASVDSSAPLHMTLVVQRTDQT